MLLFFDIIENCMATSLKISSSFMTVDPGICTTLNACIMLTLTNSCSALRSFTPACDLCASGRLSLVYAEPSLLTMRGGT